MYMKWRNGKLRKGQKQWKIGLAGFGAGVLVMLAGNMLIDFAGKDNDLVLEKAALQEQDGLQQEVIEEAEVVENEVGIKTASSVEIPQNFAEKLILYQYIEYGLRKYSEDNNKNERYFCDIEEDILPCDTEFSMKNEWDTPYRTDLSKEIIPELANNIYNFKLEGVNDTIYMSIDTFNMKIYVYDKMEKTQFLHNTDDSYMEILENITEGNENYLATMKYLILQPSSFIMNIDYGKEIYEYRNVSTDNIADEWGDVYLGYQEDAYIADVVLDKYIRDFGGEDIQYHIQDVTTEMIGKVTAQDPEHIHLIYFINIYSENTKLTVTWTPYIAGVVMVSIEGRNSEEIRVKEFAQLAQRAYDNKDFLFIDPKEDWFWMIINPKMEQDKYCYRNVNMAMNDNDNQACNELVYYIADQIIDKYIRDFKGNDVIYEVKLPKKDRDEQEEIHQYVFWIENNEEILEVEYSEESWIAQVKISRK